MTLAPAKSFGIHNNDFDNKITQANKKKYGQAQIEIKSITGLKSTAVTYQSSNPGVASVSTTGFVTPKKKGTATITVTSKENKKVKATYQVTVRNLATWLPVVAYDEISLSKGGNICLSRELILPVSLLCSQQMRNVGILLRQAATRVLSGLSIMTAFYWQSR